MHAACLAIAGPVSKGRVAPTNLAWNVDGGRLARLLELPHVDLINDLEAIGHGIGELAPGDLVTLNRGAEHGEGNRAIIAAGTGLGQAGCCWDGREHHPSVCEGGHTDFAPRDRFEVELLRHLRERYDHVGYERLSSGVGLYELYRFLDRNEQGNEETGLAETIHQQAHPAPIVRTALEGRSERCALTRPLRIDLRRLGRQPRVEADGARPHCAANHRSPATACVHRGAQGEMSYEAAPRKHAGARHPQRQGGLVRCGTLGAA